MITFRYRDASGRRREGEIRFQRTVEPVEMDIHANGWSFHVIVGKQINGKYICIPNWSIGSELGHLDDEYWNRERLCKYTSLHEDNAVAIARALLEINRWLIKRKEKEEWG